MEILTQNNIDLVPNYKAHFLEKFFPERPSFLYDILEGTPEKIMKTPSKISENLRNFFLERGDAFITDFDSCLFSEESLDKLIELAIAHLPNAEELKTEVNTIMNMGMRNEIDLKTSIQMRLDIVQRVGGITPELLEKYLEIAPAPSEAFVRKIKELNKNGVNVFIFSGGFTLFIEMWCKKHNIFQYIKEIHANELILKEDGTYTFDTEHLMTKKNGKTLTAHKLKDAGKISGKILSMGDSPRDVSIGDQGILFTQHRCDEEAYENSENTLNSDEFLGTYVQVRPQNQEQIRKKAA